MYKALDLLKNIIFENDNFIILNKPYNLAVHGGSKVEYSLIESFRAYFKQYSYLELVHRLDKDTSGCLVLAKNEFFLKKFHFLLRSNFVEKEYHALVKGNFLDVFNTTFNDSLLNNYNIKIKSKNKCTINYYSIIKCFSDCSLIKVFPVTGKMHQIRIHLSYIGNPIIGDIKYGSKNSNFVFKTLGFNRMFLHFKSIKFKCPVDNKFYFICAKYDNEFVCLLDKLRVESYAKKW